MGRKAQALLELALFLGIMLMVLLAALSYQRNIKEQKLNDVNVFAEARDRADKNHFIEHDSIDNTDTTCSGAVVGYNLNADRQANRLFQGGQRRTAASSYSVYYSNSEDPPYLDFNYYNNTNISSTTDAKKIYYVRNGDQDPKDALRLSTLDYICSIYPILSNVAQFAFNLKDDTWWKNWGGYLDIILRTISYAHFLVKYDEALAAIDKAEGDRAQLQKDDDQMAIWGWRVCDINHDGQNKAGHWYVKEITPQVYDIASTETKSVDYAETQVATPAFTSNRNVNVVDSVQRTILRRWDETMPDPTIPLAQHSFPDLDSKDVTVDLSGGQSEIWN